MCIPEVGRWLGTDGNCFVLLIVSFQYLLHLWSFQESHTGGQLSVTMIFYTANTNRNKSTPKLRRGLQTKQGYVFNRIYVVTCDSTDRGTTPQFSCVLLQMPTSSIAMGIVYTESLWTYAGSFPPGQIQIMILLCIFSCVIHVSNTTLIWL